MPYAYPQPQFDSADYLLSLLGSFWSNVYEGRDLVRGTVFARGQLDAQSYLQFMELIRACSWYDVPVFHTDNWYFLQFKQSEVQNAALATFQEQTTLVFDSNQELAYGIPQSTPLYYVPCPAELAQVSVILNRITDPSLTMTEGVDYWRVSEGILAFRADLFADDRVPMRPVYDSTGTVVDQEAGLWLFRGAFDWDTVYQQFGYALNLRMKSSEGYRQLVAVILESLHLGATARSLSLAWSAITGVPIALDIETVELIQQDARSLVIVTNLHAYKFALNSVPIVAVGDTVKPGDPLVDTLQFYEFGNGEVSPDITGLSMGAGFLANGYYGPLRFENETVPWVVETADDGLTKMSFEIHGYPGDIEQFWNEVHARGAASGETLAHLLDLRAAPIDEPQAASLPATVNPLEFLCQNLLRYHVMVVRVKTSLLGPAAIGLSAADHLHKIMPPEKAMIVLLEMSQAEHLLLEDTGTEDVPGYTETITPALCGAIEETIDTSSVSEQIWITQVHGKCE